MSGQNTQSSVQAYAVANSHVNNPVNNPVNDPVNADECCTTTRCCFDFLRGCNPDELLESLQPSADKDRLRKHVDHYNVRDVQFLYFVTLVFISTWVGTMFSFDSLEACAGDSKTRVIRNLVVWVSSFCLFMVAMRVYFFRTYIQNPIIAIFRMHTPDIYDKFMNLVFAMLLLGLVAIFVAMWSYANYQNTNNQSTHNTTDGSTKAIIMMCILVGSSILTTAWYKLIVRRVARLAKERGVVVAVGSNV